MITYKVFIVTIIVISYIIQFGNLILEKTRYSKIFKSVSGILLVIAILSSLFCFTYDGNNKLPTIEYKEFQVNNITDEFESNLKTQIIDDLHNKNYVNTNVEVETDFNTLKIYLYENGTDKILEIKKYIENKYCTPNDEVIIVNETNSSY